MDNQADRPTQIYGLDMLRCFAASLVMIYHFTYLEWANPGARGTALGMLFRVFEPVTPLVGTGWVGVEIFFVISGFVIAYTANGKSAISFFNSRVLRLVPGVWICATLSLPMLLLSGLSLPRTLHEYVASLVLFPVPPWVASSYWTLPIEIVFYASVFALLWRDAFRRVERLIWAIGGASAAVWALTFASPLLPDAAARIVHVFANSRVTEWLLFQHGCFFALGTMLWIVHARRMTAVRLTGLALFGVTCVLEIVHECGKAAEWSGVPQQAWIPVAYWMGAVLFLVASIRFKDEVNALLGRRRKSVKALGLATFPIYLLHQPVGIPIVAGLMRNGMPAAIALLVAIGVVLVLSLLVALRLEPVLRQIFGVWLGKFEKRLPKGLAHLRLPSRGLEAQ